MPQEPQDYLSKLFQENWNEAIEAAAQIAAHAHSLYIMEEIRKLKRET